MVYSATTTEGIKVAMKISFCEIKRLSAHANEIKIMKKIMKWNKEGEGVESGLNNIVKPLDFFSIG